MDPFDQEEGRYRVLLMGIGGNTEQEKESFCHHLHKTYHIPLPLLNKIVHRFPIVLKKNISIRKAESLAKTLQSYGAIVSIEERRSDVPLSLEFQELIPHQLVLESSLIGKSARGIWRVIGRVKNISDEALYDIWALIQLFDALDELTTFEETPLPINPLPPGETAPFKIVFEEGTPIKKASIAFKNASGQPIPAIDKRSKREWIPTQTFSYESRFYAPPEISEKRSEESQSITLRETSPEILLEKEIDIPEEIIPSQKQEASFFIKEMEEGTEAEERKMFEEPLSLSLEEDSLEKVLEPTEEDFKVALNGLGENEYSEGEKIENHLDQKALLNPVPFISETLQSFTEAGEEERDSEPQGEVIKEIETSSLPPSVFEEASQLLEDISGSLEETSVEEKKEIEEERMEEEFPSYSWIEDFRGAIESYYQKPHDIFSTWFETCRQDNEFETPLHSLLTLLVHGRFEQGDQTLQALENTQKVFRLIHRPNLSLEEIPPLGGTSFATGEVWRELFFRAIPKIQQVGDTILKKERWKVSDLERVIQIIPHMGHSNSLLIIRWIQKLLPEVVELDFNDISIFIDETLYRVASRLGIVDPFFDHYRGKNSMGDIKIQNFAKTAFPQNPLKIEEPMAWIGSKKEKGGHCFPIQPLCEACLFEAFCQKLYTNFDPSEKGMRVV